jgi:phenylacetate-CoA ligase
MSAMFSKAGKFFHQELDSTDFAKREEYLLEALSDSRKESTLYGVELRNFQEKKLHNLLALAWESTPFYREKYRRAGFDPTHFRSLEDLVKIPVLSKEELREAGADGLQPIDCEDSRFTISTSGSTGVAVELNRSARALWRFSATAMQEYRKWCAGDPLQNVLYILDNKVGNIDYVLADQLRTLSLESRFSSSSAKVDHHLELLEFYRPEYISSYPSTMRNLASYCLKLGLSFNCLQILNLTSEMLDMRTRRMLKKVFPAARIVETYTSTEAGFIGVECPDQGGFHIAEELVLLELQKSTKGHNPSPVIITDLQNEASLLIRYSGLGDLASVTDQECSCSNQHFRISQLHGRIVDSIYLPDGTAVSAYVLTNILSHEESVYKYQIVQQDLDSFTIRVVLAADCLAEFGEMERSFSSAFSSALGFFVNCQLEVTEDILPKVGSHKVPLVISKLREAGCDV